jgi:hypothetical protein
MALAESESVVPAFEIPALFWNTADRTTINDRTMPTLSLRSTPLKLREAKSLLAFTGAHQSFRKAYEADAVDPSAALDGETGENAWSARDEVFAGLQLMKSRTRWRGSL